MSSPPYNPPSQSSMINPLNLDDEFESLWGTASQPFPAKDSEGPPEPVRDDSPVEEVAPVKRTWVDVTENIVERNNRKASEFWLQVVKYFEKEMKESKRGYDSRNSKWKIGFVLKLLNFVRFTVVTPPKYGSGKILELQWDCNLEEIDLNAPNLLLFKYGYECYTSQGLFAMSRIDSSFVKGCMKCYTNKDFDILWFQRLRRILDKNRISMFLELAIDLLCLPIDLQRLIDVEELKLIQSPPYELAHVKLEHMYSIKESPAYVALVDDVLWCLRP
ncbi:hypothetical protein Tco_0458025 [Tanacetum coccineum]